MTPKRGNADRARVALGLDDNLATADGVGVEGDRIDTAVARGLGDLHSATAAEKFFLE